MKKSKIILLGIIFSFIGFSYASELPINNTIQQEDLQLNIFKKKNKKSRKSKKNDTSAAKDSTKSKNDYEDVADEIYRLRELKQNALVENAEREGKRQRIAEMTDFLNEQSCELEEYDEQLVRRLIEKVTVFDEKMTIEFKSGVTIEGRI